MERRALRPDANDTSRKLNGKRIKSLRITLYALGPGTIGHAELIPNLCSVANTSNGVSNTKKKPLRLLLSAWKRRRGPQRTHNLRAIETILDGSFLLNTDFSKALDISKVP